MKIVTEVLQYKTKGHTDIQDITPRVREVVQKAACKAGTVTLFVSGSTAGLTTVEYEPGLVKDLQELFERLVPSDKPYYHHERWGDDNGHSHCRASLLGPSLVIPFGDGGLALGTWQQIILVDFDTRPRDREVTVQLLGE